MITAEHFLSVAFWAGELAPEAFERARRGIVERSFAKGAYLWHRGDRFDHWTGVADGLVKVATVSKTGKAMTFAGIRTGGWFGEGSILKDEPRQYDVVALRDTRLVMMNRATFVWLLDHSVGFNRFLVRQLNERLGQFMALVEYDRTLDAPARLARTLGWLFDPVLYPRAGSVLEITQEELGLLCGLSRQSANEAVKVLERKGILRVEHGAITALDPLRLQRFGE
ncbi:Crp/Fnr family transcriptional regulator [Prosthecomicrobium sp. N25]|uniref:Crp/Fnr family transcriptional regulator n=1 Tax=Prosthecomicrobium sp. N25 TaxID=3129254 RepID=UPI003076DAB4